MQIMLPHSMDVGPLLKQISDLHLFTTTILLVVLCNKKASSLNPFFHDQINSNLIQIQHLNARFFDTRDTSR